MLVSLKWINNYIDIKEIAVDEIARRLTMAGIEVEAVTKLPRIDNLVTAKILTCEKHPEADKLNICKVFDGTEEHQIVCGAPNAAAGLTVVLAKIGAVLPGDFKIKKAKIRGAESFGMLCSERELGLSDSHDGIISLPSDIEAGIDANEVLGLGDTVLELGITPNRGDCLSIYGVARDLSAVFDIPVQAPDFTAVENGATASKDYVSVDITADKECLFYECRVIQNIKVMPSPLWMQRRIRSAGMRPINNIVDVTNYVMLEYGQPMHAFDLAVIDRGIIVRKAVDGERLTTLDDKERALDESVTVIADHSKVLALAGVMGGEHSGISDSTKDLLLECAYFTPESVAHTSRKYSINSDSSFRYARGVDYGMTESIIDYAARLLAEISGGSIEKGVVSKGTLPAPVHTVKGSVNRINTLLGTNLTADEMKNIFRKLGMKAEINGYDLNVVVPSFRKDVIHVAALSEEVARIYGVDKIPSILPKLNTDNAPIKPQDMIKRKIKTSLAGLGFAEVINYSFIAEEYLKVFTQEKPVRLINPLSEEMSTLRSLIAPGVIKSLLNNWNQGYKSVKVFETSNVFHHNPEGNQPFETEKLCMGVMGDFSPLSWMGDTKVDNFYKLKSVCENIFSGVNFEYRAENISFLHPGKCAKIYIGEKEAGYIGALHPLTAEKLDVKGDIYLAEFDMAIIYDKILASKIQYKAFSRFPQVYKDLSVLVNKNVNAGDMMAQISTVSPLIQNVNLYDVYTGAGISEDERSVTFRMQFSSVEKTLTDEEINPLLMQCAKVLETNFGAKLR